MQLRLCGRGVRWAWSCPDAAADRLVRQRRARQHRIGARGPLVLAHVPPGTATRSRRRSPQATGPPAVTRRGKAG